MSFSKQVKEELNSIQIKNNCCKRAYLFGAVLASEKSGGHLSLKLSDSDTADKVIFLLKSIYKSEPEIKKIKRGCFESTELLFNAKRLSEFLLFADTFKDSNDIDGYFTCDACFSAFLRGAFCASGSISDPLRSYTLEIRTLNEGRAALIKRITAERGLRLPKCTLRKKGIGLFYRKELYVEEFIAGCGANNSVFSFYNALVEKDFRNAENRATNCVTRNISKSVIAAATQISAIESLIATAAIEDIPYELRITAGLRLSNPDMTLGELALIHTPPISRSGLNHRLSKIVEEAKKRKLI